MEAISSNGYSHDQQVHDALIHLKNIWPEDYRKVLGTFPEIEEIEFGEHSSWFDTEAMGVDQEFSSWLCDSIENTGHILWIDGEPWALSPGETSWPEEDM